MVVRKGNMPGRVKRDHQFDLSNISGQINYFRRLARIFKERKDF